MADAPRPPVAIRISRPYATEDQFLEHEIDTLTRTSVTLLGAQPRPQGVVLRFELVLSSGQILVRGEGRVVGYTPNVHQGLGGLTLRFMRIDTKSKALLDKVAAFRDIRRPHPTEPAPAPISVSPPEPAPRAEPAQAPASAVALNRDALLDSLRARVRTLEAATIQRILAAGHALRLSGGQNHRHP